MDTLIIKVEYFDQLHCFNLNSINYVKFQSDVTSVDGRWRAAELTIKLAFNDAIVISEERRDHISDLKKVFYDIYSRWKDVNLIEDEY